MGNCVFSNKWKANERFKAWIAADPKSRTKAKSTVCDKAIDISSMSEAALKEQKKRMKSNIEALFKSADHLVEKAESTGKVTFISESKAMRQGAKEKEGELKSIEEEINKKLEVLKN